MVFRGCSADFLLHFLRSVECEYLYLVGDIIDIREMKKRPYWPQAHNDVIRTILGKAKHGTQVIYVPGNHDELLRDYDGTTFGNIRIQVDAVHTMANGQRFLIVHGDEFDSVVKCSKALALIGGRLYGLLLRGNHMVNFIRRQFGFPYWSLAAFLKHKVKNAVQYISNFEQVPVAAYPVTGPIDLIRPGVTGSLDQDLKNAVIQALRLNPDDCVAFAQNHSWKGCAEACLAV